MNKSEMSNFLHRYDRPTKATNKKVAQDANYWAALFRKQRAEEEAKEKKQ